MALFCASGGSYTYLDIPHIKIGQNGPWKGDCNLWLPFL